MSGSVQPHRVFGLHHRQNTNGSQEFRAAGKTSAIALFSETWNTLIAQGLLVDTIGEVAIDFLMHNSQTEDEKLSGALDAFKNWWQLYSETRMRKNIVLDEFEFTTTVYGGEWRTHSEPLWHTRRFSSFNYFCQQDPSLNLAYQRLYPGSPPGSAADTERNHHAMVSAASLRMHGKRFAMSLTKELPCLIPSDSQPGDIICVLLGCSFPVVVRRLPSGKYWLVGEAYIHGIMKGELMPAYETGNYVPVLFEFI